MRINHQPFDDTLNYKKFMLKVLSSERKLMRTFQAE